MATLPKLSLAAKVVLGLFVLTLVALLAYEHRMHLAGWAPLLLLLCPLMHFTMHGRHGGHKGHGAVAPKGSDHG